MTNNEIDIALIENYLRKDLSKNKLTEFEQRLKSDQDFYEKFIQMKALQLSIRKTVLTSKLNMLQNYEEELQTEKNDNGIKNTIRINQNSNSINIRLVYFATAIAASVLIIIFLLPNLRSGQSPQNQIVMQYFEPYPAHVIKRSLNQNLSGLKKKAYSLYGIDNYKKAAPLLAELCDSGDTLSCFYAGISLLGNNEPENALILFETEGLPFESDVISWYKGLCYWSIGKELNAKKVWAEIGEESLYFGKVKELLGRE